VANDKLNVLLISPSFSPNIGGVETHLDDLVGALDRRGCSTFVLTHSPITTPGIPWKSKEKIGKKVNIRRYWWFGNGLFHKVEKYPILDFLYLTPYLCFRALLFMISRHKDIDVIHSQGLNAALIGVVLKKLFSIHLIVSTHAVYEVQKTSWTANIVKRILEHADKVLCLSKASLEELAAFGLDRKKLSLYTYWVNLNIFKPLDKKKMRLKFKIKDAFTVLFVGRLIEKKGIKVLIEVAKALPNIQFLIIGVGPEENYVRHEEKENSNIIFIGKVKNTYLSQYYSCADLLCIPSLYEEGYGRVVMEAVACGLPVIGSDKGGIPEALDNSVSVLVSPTKDDLLREIRNLSNDRERYQKLKVKCADYAQKRFSEKNVSKIIKYYSIDI
jgi:glycosyltransferase involved in cell wall biosynthesis